MVSRMVRDAIGFDPANSNSFGEPVNDLSALASLASTNLQDKQIRVVESVGSIYRFDRQSVITADGIKTVKPSDLNVAVAGRWHLQSVTNHSLLERLLEDDHTQYVHKDIARTIKAIHTFAPETESPPFILGVKAQGQKVTGLNADMLDGKSSEDFIQVGADGKIAAAQTLRLANGMPAYREPVSNTLVSIATTSFSFCIKTGGTRNVYLNSFGDIASNTLGNVLPRNAMVLNAVVASSDVMGTSWNASFQIRKNGSTSPLTSLALPIGQWNKIYTGMNLQLNAGDELQAYIAASVSIANPIITIELAWRD